MSRPTINAAPSLADTRIGDRLSDYSNYDILVQRMASGGFGLVFMGPDRLDPDSRWRALKTLRSEVLAASPRSRELFLREALTWVGLWPHANLLTAQTVTEINAQLVLVLNYAEYGSLRDLLRQPEAVTWKGQPGRDGRLPLGIALRWAQQIAAGLVALHTPDPAFLRPEPLVHRDLKPENVLLDEYGFAMITDFGLAKVVQQAAAADPALALSAAATGAPASPATDTATAADDTAPLGDPDPTRSQRLQTAVGVALGTPAYMAPEQWQNAASAGPPADLYAFGLLLSELLAGRHALLDLVSPPGAVRFQPASVAAWRAAHLGGPRRPLREVVPELPARVEALYQRLLAPTQEERPTAGEALAELQAAAEALGEETYTPPETYAHTPEHEVIMWQQWANVHYRFGLHQEALARSDRAYALAPHDPYVLLNRGNILAALGRLDEALACYDASLAALPADDHLHRAGAHNQRGNLLSDAGRYAEAEAAYAAALQEMPKAADTWYNRADNERLWANAEQQAGQRDAARQHAVLAVQYVQQALTLNRANPSFHRLLTACQQLVALLGG